MLKDNYEEIPLKKLRAFFVTAETLLELLNNPVHCKEMSRRGREAILEHFTWEKTSRKIEKVLRDIR